MSELSDIKEFLQHTRLDGERAYCIFEGGGAKGYAHVGVLDCIETIGFDVRGFAGTSAGAIIATLASVGYSAKDMIDLAGGTHLIQTLYPDGDVEPLDLLGDGRDRIERMVSGSTWRAARQGFWQFGVMGRHGLSSTKNFRKAMERAISQRLNNPAMARATFAELFDHTGVHLRMVGANITRRTLTLFSAEETPNVVVADAVAASAAIPGLFDPVRFSVPSIDNPGREEPADFVDGGLVSNLPAWAFDAERSIDREAITVLSTIDDPAEETPMFKPIHYVEPIFRTGVFGGSRLNVRNIGRSLTVQLNVTRGLLDFEPKADVLETELEDAFLALSLAALDEVEISDWIDRVRDVAELEFGALSKKGHKVRAALATANRSEPYVNEYADGLVQLRYCSGHEFDPDYRQTLSYERSLLGGVLRDRMKARARFREDFPGRAISPVSRPYFFDREAVLAQRANADERDRRVISQIPADLEWWIYVPIESLTQQFPYTNVAICLDGNFPIDTGGQEFRTRLNAFYEYILASVPTLLVQTREDDD